MPNTNQEIRARIDEFLTQITALVRQAALESLRAVLGEAAPARRRPGRPRKATRRRKAGRKATGRRTRRSSADVERIAAKVLAYVRGHPGERLEEIGRGLKTASVGLTRPIQALLAAGALRTEGLTRGTRYFAGGRGGRKAKVARKRGKKARRSKARRKVANRAKRKARKKATRARASRKVARKAPSRKSARRSARKTHPAPTRRKTGRKAHKRKPAAQASRRPARPAKSRRVVTEATTATAPQLVPTAPEPTQTA